MNWFNFDKVVNEGNMDTYKEKERVTNLVIRSSTYGLIILFIMIIIASIFLTVIKPGYVGVVVNNLNNDLAIEQRELDVGYHLLAPWKTVYKFPIYEQNHQWVGGEGFKFQTSEGLSVSADIGITFNVEPSKVHQLFYKYRRGIDEIAHLFIKNNLRDAMNKVSSKMLISDLYGAKKEYFFEEVHKLLANELSNIGFNISHIFIIGEFKVPEMVMIALNRKIEATQRAQQRENELRESEAQAKKEMAIADGHGKSKVIASLAEAEALMIESRAKADANALVNKSLTADLLRWHFIEKWDGVLPKASGEGMKFLIDLK